MKGGNYMQKVTMQMVDRRKPSNIMVECTDSARSKYTYQHILESYRFEDAKRLFLEDWTGLHGDPVVCGHSCIALFEHCIDQDDNINHLQTLGNIITEGIIPKIRDGGQTRNYIKNKIARFKTKLHTNFKTKNATMKDTVSNSIENIAAKISQTTKSAGAPVSKQGAKAVAKEEAVLGIYENMNEELDRIAVCDTILNNQGKLSNRFNLSKVIEESADIEDAVFTICECIDTYRMGIKHKYNVALQNIPYLLYTNGVKYNTSEVLEQVTNYFLLTSENPDIPTMQKVLEHNTAFLFEKADIEGLSYMFKDIAKLDIKFDDTMTLLQEVDVSKTVTKALSTSKDKIKDLLNDFKKSADKTPEKLRSIVNRIYTQPADEIIEEYPDILGMIRGFVLLVVPGSINPILSVVALCADYAIKLHMSRKQIDKYIEKHKKEIEKADKKIAAAKTDESKEKLKKYKESLTKGLDKLKDYRDKLYSEKEVEAIRDKEMENDIDFGDDINFDDDEFFKDLDFKEAVNLVQDVSSGVELVESVIDTDKLTKEIYRVGQACTESDYKVFFDFYKNYLSESAYYKFIMDAVDPLYGYFINETSSSENYSKRETLKEMTLTMYDRDKWDKKETLTESIARLKTTIDQYNEISNYLAIVKESLQEDNYMLTEGFKENLKLASIKLKDTARGLVDKEKQLSRTIDANMNTFARAAERAFMNDNREAVIRGSLIPSASKCIKGAIMTGAAWAVNPALAVIGVLGYIGVSKGMQAKERQLILDEIEIELQMNEKYLRIAEDNNDMKATRELLKIQRDLQRQRQRIKYKMKVYHNQTTGLGPGSVGGDDD